VKHYLFGSHIERSNICFPLLLHSGRIANDGSENNDELKAISSSQAGRSRSLRHNGRGGGGNIRNVYKLCMVIGLQQRTYVQTAATTTTAAASAGKKVLFVPDFKTIADMTGIV
jgi:hypothetical protein